MSFLLKAKVIEWFPGMEVPGFVEVWEWNKPGRPFYHASFGERPTCLSPKSCVDWNQCYYCSGHVRSETRMLVHELDSKSYRTTRVVFPGRFLLLFDPKGYEVMTPEEFKFWFSEIPQNHSVGVEDGSKFGGDQERKENSHD